MSHRQRQPHVLCSQPAQGGIEIGKQAFRLARSGRDTQRLEQDLDPPGQCGSLGPRTALKQIAKAGRAGRVWAGLGWRGWAGTAGAGEVHGWGWVVRGWSSGATSWSHSSVA